MENYMNNPMRVSDASSMLRITLKKNMKPYDHAVIKLNNRMVDEWEDKVLKKMATDEGTIPCSQVWPSWQLFRDGTWISNYMKSENMAPEITETQVQYWKDFFENLTVEEMHDHGVLLVDNGWYTLNKYIKEWLVKQRWEKVFSQSNDPYEWYVLSKKHSDLMKGKILPFWDNDHLREIAEKVETVLKIQVRPSS
jgi:hypothetical protein